MTDKVAAAQHRADRLCQKTVGNELVRLYSEMAAEPIPENFLLLLEEVDRKTVSNRRAP